MFDILNKLFGHLVEELGYNSTVHIKDTVSMIACFLAGFLLCILYTSWLYRRLRKDKRLDDGVALLRAKDSRGRSVFITSSRPSVATSVLNHFIILFMYLRIYRKDSIHFDNVRGARITMVIVSILTTLLIIIGLWFSTDIIDPREVLKDGWYRNYTPIYLD